MISLQEVSASQLDTVDPGIVGIAAAYWADSKVGTDGGFYTKYITDFAGFSNQREHCERLVGNTSFAFIATWSNMEPNVADPYATDVSIQPLVAVLCEVMCAQVVDELVQDKVHPESVCYQQKLVNICM